MLGVLLAALTTPEPSATPLKTISHAHASAFCTTMRENIRSAVGALLQNDVAVSQGKSIFLKMAHDQVSTVRYRSDPQSSQFVIDLDMVQVDKTIGEMAKNLSTLDTALNDLKHIPEQPKSDDDRRLVEMRDALRAIADRQRQALNVFSGTYYSYSSNELLARTNPIAGALQGGKAGASAGEASGNVPIAVPPSEARAAVQAASQVRPSPAASRSTVPVVDIGLAGGTPWAKLFNTITTYQLQEEPLESQAAQSIVKYADECK